MRLGPYSCYPIFWVDLGAFLDSRPSKEGVVTNERGDCTSAFAFDKTLEGGPTISVGYHQRDVHLEHRGEEGHCVFEKVICDLHDSGCVLAGNKLDLGSWLMGGVDLHDGDIGTLLHLESGIHETVFGNPGIGINQEDDLSTRRSAMLEPFPS